LTGPIQPLAEDVPPAVQADPVPHGQGSAPGRLLAVLLLLVLAFGAGIAVDRATGPAVPDSMSPAATPTQASPASTPAGTPPAGTPGPGTAAAATATPPVTPAPTIGPGATVAPFAPANVGILWDALKLIQENYVHRSTLNPDELTYGMVDGLVDSLGDPGHTIFLTPEELQSENDSLSGTLVGIGVYLGEDAGGPVIISVFSGTPASKAGLLPGDRLIAVDGRSVENLSVPAIAAIVRGKEGTPVTVTIIHAHSATPIDITIIRATITVPAVTWAMLPGTQFADVRIAQFQERTADEFRAAIREARRAGAKGVVLDLRNDPGGYVSEAVGVISELIGQGTAYVRQFADGRQTPVPVKPGGTTTDVPLVVLVDYGTASAAEIVAGAIQDANRAQVVGIRSFGTGTVLNTFDLPDGSALRLAVEEWLTPTGRHIFPGGIIPDVVIDIAGDVPTLEPDNLRALTPADLAASGDTQILKAISLLEGN